MNVHRTLDVSELLDYSVSSQSPVWWGQLLLTLIEGTMFFILIAMYFYDRLNLDVWPPPGTRVPEFLLPTLALIPLIASAWGVYSASEGAKRDDRTAMLRGMGINLVLGAVFLALQVANWSRFNFVWKSDIHGSLVWTILGLYTLDAVADLLFTLALFVMAAAGYHTSRLRLAVHVDSVVWYFVVLIWLPLYVVIYWGPHIVGTA